MRPIAVLVSLALSALLPAQIADFKIFPGAVTQFDQTCTSFTSRCSLGGAAGELLQEFPMASMDANGASTDFFRGIGQVSSSTCEISNIFYLTQDQNCVDQETYRVIMRGLDGAGSGPDTTAKLFDSGPLLTPPNGAPGACAWGINLTLATPAAVSCEKSLFVGLELAANSAWVANGQSLQGAWYTSGTIGDVPSSAAADFAWQISGGTAGQCGTKRAWDLGVSTTSPVAMSANIHADARCGVSPAPGVGGLYPSNTVRGDGLALRIRDSAAFRPDGDAVIAFMSFSVSPVGIPLPGIISANSIWIGPNPFIQVAFGAVTISGGEATLTPAFLAPGLLTGLAGELWFQGLIARTGLPFPMTNAVAAKLGPN